MSIRGGYCEASRNSFTLEISKKYLNNKDLTGILLKNTYRTYNISNKSNKTLLFINENVEELLSHDNGISFNTDSTNGFNKNKEIINHLFSGNISLLNDDIDSEFDNTKNYINDLSSNIEDNNEVISTENKVDIEKSQNINSSSNSISSNTNNQNDFENYLNSLKHKFAFNNTTASLIGHREEHLEISDNNEK